MGLVSFLKWMDIEINEIRGISVLSEREWIRDDAPARHNPHTLGLVLYGHTYLSRVHSTVQCMTMIKGTVKNRRWTSGQGVCHIVVRAKRNVHPDAAYQSEMNSIQKAD